MCVVPSELRAYGVWDAAESGLSELRDSSSSLLFLTLSEAQARLLHTELSALHKHIAGELRSKYTSAETCTPDASIHGLSFFSPALPVCVGAPDRSVG